MAVTAQSIIDRVRIQLVDTATTQRWTDAELLYWISDGQRAIVAALPHAAIKTATTPLVAGTRQSLPADGYRLMDIPRNLSGGGTAGAPCTSVDRIILDRQYPTWHTANASATVLHWTYDPNDPTAFFVFPTNTGSGSVEVVYSFNPPDITVGASNISVRDIFQTALIDYTLYRAHSKDSDFAAGQQLAGAFLQAFTVFLQAQGGGQK